MLRCPASDANLQRSIGADGAACCRFGGRGCDERQRHRASAWDRRQPEAGIIQSGIAMPGTEWPRWDDDLSGSLLLPLPTRHDLRETACRLLNVSVWLEAEGHGKQDQRITPSWASAPSPKGA